MNVGYWLCVLRSFMWWRLARFQYYALWHTLVTVHCLVNYYDKIELQSLQVSCLLSGHVSLEYMISMS